MTRRVPRRAPALSTAVLVLLLAGLVGAGPAAARPVRAAESTPAAAGGVDPDVLVLLRRSSGAEARLTYRGTQLVSTWDEDGADSAVLDVLHVPGEGTTTWPHVAEATPPPTGATTVPDELPGTSWVDAPAGVDASLSVLLGRYDVTDAGPADVAGRSVRVLELRRAGALAARLWLDAGTGLVLRRELYDGTGRTVQAMSYLDVEVLAGSATTATPRDEPDGGRAVDGRATASAGLAQLRRQGWRCPDDLAGLPLLDARTMTTDAAAGASVLHLTYTDGLRTLSVYQQHGHLDHRALAGYSVKRVDGHDVSVQAGLATRAVWDAGDTVLTVVADLPDEQLPAVVAALPPVTAGGRGWMSSAAERVLSAARWITPLR